MKNAIVIDSCLSKVSIAPGIGFSCFKRWASNLFVLIFCASALVMAQEPLAYSMLDPNPYNPKTDPNIDMFMAHWSESRAKVLHNAMVERPILTSLEGDDPLHPTKRGAVLIYMKSFSYATLFAGANMPPTVLLNEQEIYIIVGGHGYITAKGETFELKKGVMMVVPQDLEFSMTCTGDEALQMYVMTEPTPAGFVPNTQLVVKDENKDPLGGTTGHWAHVTKTVFRPAQRGGSDGIATITGFCPVRFGPMTMGQPHSHSTGECEEVWFSMEEECTIMLGKQLRAFKPGMAYKIPPDGMTPHSTINVSNKDAKVFWFMVNKHSNPDPPTSQLFKPSFNPELDLEIDPYIGSWKQSVSRITHGSLVERDILTAGDHLNPPAKSAVLKYASRFTQATLGALESTAATTLKGEQEIFYVFSGSGTVSSKDNTAELHPGVAVLIPPDVEFTIQNTANKTLKMYLIGDPCPAGFKPNKVMKIVDENLVSMDTEIPHWTGLSKQLFKSEDGLASLMEVTTVQFEPMTIYHPHSLTEGNEEVWVGVSGDAHFLLGKQIRPLEQGTAYLIPPNGRTPYTNFNVSAERTKLLRFTRSPE